MSPSELSKELEKGKFRPVYYFYGEEDYRIKEAEKFLVGKFLPRPQQTTNHVILSAVKTRFDDLLTELSVVPMLGERQVFTINEAQSFSVGQVDKILALLEPPDPNRVVILTSPSARQPRKTTNIFKHLFKKTMAVEFSKLRRDSAERQILSRLRGEKIEIEPDALRLLADVSGGDFGGIVSEVNKLIDYAGEGGKIDVETVTTVCSDYQTFKVFELAARAAKGEFDRAMAVINSLLRKGERATAMLFWLGEHFIGLYLTQNRKKYGKKDTSWKYRGQMNQFDNIQLEKIIQLIADADLELRDNIKPDRLILEELIFNICSFGKNAADG